jgi:hypothetical protein
VLEDIVGLIFLALGIEKERLHNCILVGNIGLEKPGSKSKDYRKLVYDRPVAGALLIGLGEDFA